MNLLEGQLPGSLVMPGDNLLLRIVSIDREHGHLGLSVNRVTDPGEMDWIRATIQHSNT